MKIAATAIAGVVIAESEPIRDHRGFLSRLHCTREMKAAIGSRQIAQANLTLTRAVGAVRGMHFQRAPHAEMKIVRCLRGRVFDVAVDLRRGSATLLRWVSCELSPDNARALVIPEGCAHGFQVLEPDTELLYLHTTHYSRDAEGGVRHDDPRVGIAWPLPPTEISDRDRNHPLLDTTFTGLAA